MMQFAKAGAVFWVFCKTALHPGSKQKEPESTLALRLALTSIATAFSEARNRGRYGHPGRCGRGRADPHGRDGTIRHVRGGHNHGGPIRDAAVHRPPAGRPVAAAGTPREVAGTPRPAARRLAVPQPRGPDDKSGRQWIHSPTSPHVPGPQKEFREQLPILLTEYLFSYARFDAGGRQAFRNQASIISNHHRLVR